MLEKGTSDFVDIATAPSTKRILNTSITVDCFNIKLANCSHYFLSHFHADHYTKLTKTFKHPVFCSETTAALVRSRIGASAVALQMYTTYDFESFSVRLIEANHCPGAVCFLFLVGDQLVFHTGDFRYNRAYHLFDLHFNSLYLDNTYENMPVFPSQKDAIVRILSMFDQKNKLVMPKICILCCTYCVGKEKIFLSVAEYLDGKVQVSEEKMETYKCYSKYSIDLINKEVEDIVGNKRQADGTYRFKRKREEISVELLEVNCGVGCEDSVRCGDEDENSASYAVSSNCTKPKSLCKSSSSKAKSFKPALDNEIKINFKPTHHSLLDTAKEPIKSSKGDSFSRITTTEQLIKVIKMSDLPKLSSIISGVNADRIVVLCGSGWKEKVDFRTYLRTDGRKVPRGIEMVYFRYSEHSSSEELEEFKSKTLCDRVINTVNETEGID